MDIFQIMSSLNHDISVKTIKMCGGRKRSIKRKKTYKKKKRKSSYK
jgi:hypothetical protein